jgi:hypothetical protein
MHIIITLSDEMYQADEQVRFGNAISALCELLDPLTDDSDTSAGSLEWTTISHDEIVAHARKVYEDAKAAQKRSKLKAA